jgi:hypothetical protein
LFVSPGTVRDCTLKQGSIAEFIGKDRLEKIQIRYRRVVSQNTSDYNKRRKLV